LFLEAAPTQKFQHPIRLDPKYCHQHLEIDKDGIMVTENSKQGSTWRTVLATKPFFLVKNDLEELSLKSVPQHPKS